MEPTAPIVLALVLCLRAQPDICLPPVPIAMPERTAGLAADPVTLGTPTLMECITGGQQIAADWSDKHPQFVGYSVRVTCSNSGIQDRSAG